MKLHKEELRQIIREELLSENASGSSWYYDVIDVSDSMKGDLTIRFVTEGGPAKVEWTPQQELDFQDKFESLTKKRVQDVKFTDYGGVSNVFVSVRAPLSSSQIYKLSNSTIDI